MKYSDLEDEWSRTYVQFILDNPDKDWDCYCLSENKNITWKVIQESQHMHGYIWEWEDISQNPDVTWEIIQANPHKEWDWYGISRNPNITMEIIQDNIDKPWKWGRGVYPVTLI